jgi:hypothetical protein
MLRSRKNRGDGCELRAASAGGPRDPARQLGINLGRIHVTLTLNSYINTLTCIHRMWTFRETWKIS